MSVGSAMASEGPSPFPLCRRSLQGHPTTLAIDRQAQHLFGMLKCPELLLGRASQTLIEICAFFFFPKSVKGYTKIDPDGPQDLWRQTRWSAVGINPPEASPLLIRAQVPSP